MFTCFTCSYFAFHFLQPRKICLLGPPAVGKSSVAVKLCGYYKLHHINVNEAIDEKVRQLVSEDITASFFIDILTMSTVIKNNCCVAYKP